MSEIKESVETAGEKMKMGEQRKLETEWNKEPRKQKTRRTNQVMLVYINIDIDIWKFNGIDMLCFGSSGFSFIFSYSNV